MNLLVLILLVGNCLAQTLSIHYSVVPSHKEHAFATIEYAPGSKKATVQIEDIPETSGDICLGTASLPHHECFAYSNTLKRAQFHIYLDSSGNIDHLAANSANEASVTVHPFVAAPVPNLNPESYRKKAAAQKVLQKKVITDEDGEEVEVEEEVVVPADERSFIQKYWMYIVPPLLLFMMAGDR